MDTQNTQQNGGSGEVKSEGGAMKMPEHAKNGSMVFGILAYLGILVIVPWLAKKNDPFVKFHVKQGLVLVSISIIIWLLGSVLGGYGTPMWMAYRILNLGVLVLSIMGVVNVVQNQMKELPLVGHFSKYFNKI